MLKVEWGWFTFRNTHSPLPNVMFYCDVTFKKYVLYIEEKLLNNAIRTKIDQIIDRNRTQCLELYYQRQPQQTNRQPE